MNEEKRLLLSKAIIAMLESTGMPLEESVAFLKMLVETGTMAIEMQKKQEKSNDEL